jgi:hypothetical protein
MSGWAPPSRSWPSIHARGCTAAWVHSSPLRRCPRWTRPCQCSSRHCCRPSRAGTATLSPHMHPGRHPKVRRDPRTAPPCTAATTCTGARVDHCRVPRAVAQAGQLGPAKQAAGASAHGRGAGQGARERRQVRAVVRLVKRRTVHRYTVPIPHKSARVRGHPSAPEVDIVSNVRAQPLLAAPHTPGWVVVPTHVRMGGLAPLL